MLTKQFAEQFAHSWIEAWNSRDLARVLAYYSDDFQFSSPKIPQIAGEPSGKLQGKAAVGAYWAKGLELRPALKFELITLFVGIDTIVLHYRDEREMISAETMDFGPDNLVHISSANHAL